MRGAVAETMRLGPKFSAAVFASKKSYKRVSDQERLASSLRKAGLPE